MTKIRGLNRHLDPQSLTLPVFPFSLSVTVAAMGRAAEEEGDVEFADYDLDDEDAMEEDGRAARALPVPRIVSPAVVRTRGRFVGRSPSVLTSSRYRFDFTTNDGDHGPIPLPQRCEDPLLDHFLDDL